MIAIGITVIICITVVALTVISNESKRKERIEKEFINNLITTPEGYNVLRKMMEVFSNEKQDSDAH